VIQKLLRLFTSSATFSKIEAESRDWFWTCPSCGHEFSVWDKGGIRYKASGNPIRLVRCPSCDRTAMLRLERGK
jgi:hypothetical protein